VKVKALWISSSVKALYTCSVIIFQGLILIMVVVDEMGRISDIWFASDREL